MAASHQPGIQGNAIHQRSEARHRSQALQAQARLVQELRGIKHQLERSVARLSVDVDGPGKIRRSSLLQPVIVIKPAPRLGNGDKISRARMVEAMDPLAILIKHLLNTGKLLDKPLDRGSVFLPTNIDMGHLVITQGEGFGGSGVEQLSIAGPVYLQQPGLPESPVDGVT